jgi:hypothetical protein
MMGTPATEHMDISLPLDATSDSVTLGIHSEYDPLKVVLVHHPGGEIDRLTPNNRRCESGVEKGRWLVG